MRRLVLDIGVSLDGFIAGPDGDIDWLRFNQEMAELTNRELLAQVDTIVYGRKAYEVFGLQPEEVGLLEPAVREFQYTVTHMAKLVFSHNQPEVDATTTVVGGELVREIRHLQDRPGKHLWLFGGGQLAGACLRAGLLDEVRLAIHPIVLGRGTPLFADVEQKRALVLVHAETLTSGVIHARYRPG